MAPVLTPALLSGLAGNIVGLERPGVSPLLASFEVKGRAKGFTRELPKSGAPRPSHEVGLDLQIPDSMDDVLKYEPYSWEMSQQDSPEPDVNPEDISEIIIDDSDDLDKTIEALQAPIVEPAPSKKQVGMNQLPPHPPPRSARRRRERLVHHLWRMICPKVSGQRTSSSSGTTLFVVITHGFIR